VLRYRLLRHDGEYSPERTTDETWIELARRLKIQTAGRTPPTPGSPLFVMWNGETPPGLLGNMGAGKV